MNHSDASRIAENLANWLAPYCLRPPVVVGSIRRGKPEVKDCEILVMPDPKTPRPEFGGKVFKTGLDKFLDQLMGYRTLTRVKGGEVYRQFTINTSQWNVETVNPFKLDLFIVTDPATWGVQMVVRTGPWEFSQWVVTSVDKGGALPYGYHFDDKNPWHVTGFEGNIKPMPEEKDFLEFLGLGWIEPAARMPNWRKAQK